MCSLLEWPYFSILADACQDISTREELSICARWLVNGKPEEHFQTVFHVCSTDADNIAEFLQPFLKQKQPDLRKLIGQGFDGAATFAGKIVKFLANPDLLCSCNLHPLFLLQVTARFNSGSCISEGNKLFFGTMTSVWTLFSGKIGYTLEIFRRHFLFTSI